MPKNALKPREKKTFASRLSWLVHQQLFIPLAALALLILFNLIGDSSFFSIYIRTNNSGNKVLGGNLISVINDGSELAILAIGMTLVTAASGGQDISVGANMAIAGSVIMRILCGSASVANQAQAPVIVAFLAACGVCMLFGAFNGILVAYLKLQPMVATLILFTAGRSIASWINHAQPNGGEFQHQSRHNHAGNGDEHRSGNGNAGNVGAEIAQHRVLQIHGLGVVNPGGNGAPGGEENQRRHHGL